ncbi:MAG: hypothetical protein KatS3mg095_0658 [Candidatus Parcubacteria bacterium]|nr:MAG: hypothetical protein KatS3mg095_0658 [Candidatus Parcubacteria bacterium]
MLNHTTDTFIYLIKNLTTKDVIDISLLSFIISLILYSFSETKFFKVITGIMVIGALFLVSNWFNLILTKIFFQSFFNVILIIVIIIFSIRNKKSVRKI